MRESDSNGVRLSRHTVPANARGERLDRWLSAHLPDLSRSQVARLREAGAIRLDGVVPNKAGVKLSGGEEIEVRFPAPPDAVPQPQSIPLDVLYEDDQVVVVNKPAGMVVHPAPGHQASTLVNAILHRYPNLNDPDQPDRPGIVHRLDRDTSGIVIVARTTQARRFLQQQFRKRTTEKEYIALVLGHPETARGTIEAPVGRHPTHRQKRAVVPGGRPATTHYDTVETYEEATLLRVVPVTGRTHQIRVHLAAIGLPVAGDVLYGPRRTRIADLDRHFLHAGRLAITLPKGDRRAFEAPLPEELQQVLSDLRTPG